MANILERAAEARRTTVTALVVETIERLGNITKAAKEIGVSKPIIWDWLSDNGYRVVTGRWAKVIPPAPAQEATVSSDVLETRYEPIDD